jgi:hypothetical protein
LRVKWGGETLVNYGHKKENIRLICLVIKRYNTYMENLWNKEVEQKFFNESTKFAAPEQLFYVTNSGKYLAYWPKGYGGKKSTLQNRNSLIGNFTER